LLITPGAGRFFLAERFQGRLLLVKTWERGKGGYALYEVVQDPQQAHSEIRSEGDR